MCKMEHFGALESLGMPGCKDVSCVFGMSLKKPSIEAKIKGNFDPVSRTGYAIKRLIKRAEEKYGIKPQDTLFGIRFGRLTHVFRHGYYKHLDYPVENYSKSGTLELICYKL